MYEQGGFLKWLDIFRDIVPNETLPPGMSRRCVTLGGVMQAMHEAFPNLETEDHTHESAQIACMVRGKMAISIDGCKQCLEPKLWSYPSPHG